MSLIELNSGSGSICNDISGEASENKLQNIHTALGSVSGVTGFSGAASGIVSIVKTAMSLRNDVLPPASLLLKNGQSLNERFHLPAAPSFWFKNANDKKRHAAVFCNPSDNQSSVAILSEYQEKRVFQSFRPNHGFL